MKSSFESCIFYALRFYLFDFKISLSEALVCGGEKNENRENLQQTFL